MDDRGVSIRCAMQNTHTELESSAFCLDVTGVLLAGGQSRRMGRDKAKLQLNGRSLADAALDLLQRFFARVIIAGARPDLASPAVQAFSDIYPGSALGGLHTGLSAAQTEWIFVAPCDMPFPDGRIVQKLLARRDGCDAVVPRTPDGFEPVFALYHRNCLPRMEGMLQQGRFRIGDLFAELNIRYLDPPELPSGWRNALANINTPEQFHEMEKALTCMYRLFPSSPGAVRARPLSSRS